MAVVGTERAVWLARHILPHEPALRAWLSGRARGGADIDDIVQEAYARLAALDDVAHITSPRAYFFQVAKTVILMQMRREKIVPLDFVDDFEALDVPAADPSPETVAGDRQAWRRLEAMIARLPAQPRKVFLLRKVHGLSQRETAEQLGLSESTVEKHFGKSLKFLMDAMKGGGIQDARASSQVEKEPETANDVSRRQRRD